MKTTLEGEQLIVDFFTEFLPTKEESKIIEQSYSLGFKRLSQLSKSKQKQAFLTLYTEGFGYGVENQIELKRRLENMTKIEFNNFKK